MLFSCICIFFTCFLLELFSVLSVTKYCITLLLKELIDSPDSSDVCGGGFTHQIKLPPLHLCARSDHQWILCWRLQFLFSSRGVKRGEPLAPTATEAERNESTATLCQLSVIINSLTILSANYTQSVSAFRAISF